MNTKHSVIEVLLLIQIESNTEISAIEKNISKVRKQNNYRKDQYVELLQNQ